MLKVLAIRCPQKEYGLATRVTADPASTAVQLARRRQRRMSTRRPGSFRTSRLNCAYALIRPKVAGQLGVQMASQDHTRPEKAAVADRTSERCRSAAWPSPPKRARQPLCTMLSSFEHRPAGSWAKKRPNYGGATFIQSNTPNLINVIAFRENVKADCCYLHSAQRVIGMQKH